MDRKKVAHLVKRRVLPAAGLVGTGVLLANLAVVGTLLERGYDFVRNKPRTGNIQVSIVDGTRQPFDPSRQVLLTVIDGNQKQVLRRYVRGSRITVTDLRFHNNFGDRHIVIVWSPGYKQAGFHPVKLKRGETVSVNLMLIPSDYELDFSSAGWQDIRSDMPDFHSYMSDSGALPDAEAKARYERLMQEKPLVIAHLLNVATVLSSIKLPSGESILPYYREVIDDETLKQDKFFSWVDRRLVDKMREAVAQGTFEYAAGSQVFHRGNTASFKEVNYWEANVQITFYERDSKIVDGVELVRVDTDIDYYRDPAGHILLEVIPNTIGGSMTNPVNVYQLRWISAHSVQGPPFEPPYTIVPRR